VSINVASKFSVRVGLVGTLLISAQVLAEDRPEVLERIAPIGKVNVEAQAAEASAPTKKEAPAETAAAPEAAAPEAAAPEAAAPEAAAPEAAAPEAAAPEAAASEAAAPEAAPAETAAPAAAGGDQLALATTSGCMACHQVEVKVVGPAYKDVANKYRGDAAALDMLAAKVKAGGVGTWGQIPMPPNVQVSDENIRAIVTWVLSL
jgi:cytochrome c